MEAAARIPPDATVAVSGFGSVGYPKLIPEALVSSERDLSLTVVSGGSVGSEIDTTLVEADAIERRFPFVATSAARAAINNDRIAFHDRHISHLGDEVALRQLADVDVAIVEAVAVGEDWLIPSTSIGHTPIFVESASHLLVEVNEAQPLSLQQFHDITPHSHPPRDPVALETPDDRIGNDTVPFDPAKLDGIVRVNRHDSSYTFRDPTSADKQIASNLRLFLEREFERSPLFRDTVCLQFGVGSLGNVLMEQLKEVDFGDREVIYFGEVIQDGLIDLLDAGDLSAASATSLAMSAEGQERLFSEIDRYASDVILRPAYVSNSPELISRFGVIGVNSAIEVDLAGHVNATHVDGSRLVNGIGGGGDFSRNAPISITALPSTAKDGAISRIVPMVTHVDHTEHDISVIVTEQGIADLRGRSPRERSRVLIERCAHPSFRPALEAYREVAEAHGGHIPHDLDSVFDWEDL